MNMASTLFVGATLIDGTGAEPRRDAAVLVSDGRIAHIGRASDAEARGAEVVDLRGQTLLPGLVSAHEHFSMKGFEGKYYDQHRQDARMQLLRAAQAAYRAIAEGITSARDCGAHGSVNLPLRDGIAAGVAQGPRIRACGQVIQPVLDSPGVQPVGMTREAGDAAEVRRLADDLLREGVDFIKVKAFRTDFKTQARRTFTVAEARPAVEAAKAAGKRTACHVWYEEDMRTALEAGFDGIEHALYLGAALDLIDELARRRMFLVPCWHSWMVSQHGTPERAADHRRVISRAIERGIPVGVGTDLYAASLVDEMAALAEMGLGPLGAIRAATQVGATIAGLDDAGTVAAGKRADLIAVEGDALKDLNALRAPTLVVKDGATLVGRTVAPVAAG